MNLLLVYIRIQVLYYTGRAISYFTKKKTPLTISVDSIINGFSYRYGDRNNRMLNTVMCMKLVIKKIWKKLPEETIKTYHPGTETAVLYATHAYESLIIHEYLEPLGEDRIQFAAVYDKINLQGKLFVQFALTLLVCLNLPYLLLLFILNRKTEKFAFYELLEIAIVTHVLGKKKITTVYTLNSYEKFSNFFALVLQKYNIEISKICSPNPIEYHYATVVADTFIFTAPFQMESFERLKKDWFIKKTKLWPIYTFNECRKLYFNHANKQPPVNMIGFYSSGYPIRIEKGINIVGHEMYDSEVELIKMLSNFLEKYPDFDLKIYLHPIEKSNPIDNEKSKMYYRNFFENVSERISFLEPSIPTIEDFHGVNVALSVCSSINYERLYSGYKALYCQTKHQASLFKGTKLDGITINAISDFDRLLLEALNATDYQFFTIHNIEEYVFYGI